MITFDMKMNKLRDEGELLDPLIFAIKNRNSEAVNREVSHSLIDYNKYEGFCVAHRIYRTSRILDHDDYQFFASTLNPHSLKIILHGIDRQNLYEPNHYHKFNNGVLPLLNAVIQCSEDLGMRTAGIEALSSFAGFVSNSLETTTRFISKVYPNSVNLYSMHISHFRKAQDLRSIELFDQEDLDAWVLVEEAFYIARQEREKSPVQLYWQVFELMGDLGRVMSEGFEQPEAGTLRCKALMQDVLDAMRSRLAGFVAELNLHISARNLKTALSPFGNKNTKDGRSTISERLGYLIQNLDDLPIEFIAKRALATEAIIKFLSISHESMLETSVRNIIRNAEPFLDYQEVCSRLKGSKIDPLIKYSSKPESLIGLVDKEKRGALLTNSFGI